MAKKQFFKFTNDEHLDTNKHYFATNKRTKKSHEARPPNFKGLYKCQRLGGKLTMSKGKPYCISRDYKRPKSKYINN